MTKITIKWLKRATLILAIIPLLLFLAFAGAVSLIDFNQYKPQIEQEVSKLTNRDFKIEGEVKASVLPFKFYVGHIALKNPQGFEQENLMTMKEAQIELSLSQLFWNKKLKILSLELIEPKVHFIQHAHGNNWQNMPFLASWLPAEQMASLRYATLDVANIKHQLYQVTNALPGPDLTHKVPHHTTQEDWSLKSLVIKNAQVEYTHTQQKFTVSLKEVNLLTFDVLPNKPFQISSDFIYEHSQSPRKFDFQINGQFLLTNHYTQLHLKDWSGVFRLQLPETMNRPEIRLTTSGRNLMLDFEHQQIYVNKAKLEGLDATVVTSFQGEFGANPIYQGVFESEKINLPKWIENLGLPAPKMVDKKALSDVGGSFSWRWDGKVLKLDEVNLQVDDAKVSGQLEWPMLKKQAIKFDLAIDDLNSTKYRVLTDNTVANLAQKSTSGDSTRPGQPVQVTPTELKSFYPIPLHLLQGRTAEGKLQFTHFTSKEFTAKKMTLAVSSTANQTALAPFDIEFNQGVLLSKLLVDFTAEQPKYLWQGQTKNVPLNQVLTDGFALTKGELNAHFMLQTQGDLPKQWVKNLSGSVNANIHQAALEGLDINQLLSGQVVLADSKKSATQFKHIRLDGEFKKGVFTPKIFLAKSQRFNALGTGKLNLNSQQVKGRLDLTIVNPAPSLAELKGLSVPLRYQGSVQNPKWSVDLAGLHPNVLSQAPVLSVLKSVIE